MTDTKTISKGLAGVLADTSAVSFIDGEAGVLAYRGYPIGDLVVACSFAQVVGLVLDGEIPDPPATASIERCLAAHRELPPAALAVLRQMPRDTHPMTMLQVVLPLLDGVAAKGREKLSTRAEQRQALLAICAKVPTLVAAWARLREGFTPLSPRPELPIHRDFLRMLRAGEEPLDREVAILDVTQILQMEHGFNASTFAGRVVASTLCPMSMTLSACVGALYGPLHGGADEAAYRMALEIGSPERAPAWVDEKLARKEKIMGLGHREYRVVDPRAVILRELALELGDLKGQGNVVRTLHAVDAHAEKRFAESGKRIRANVEFYKGAVFAALGLAPDLFTAMFVMSRIYGWGAHVLELWDDHKLYRPQSQYDGPPLRRVT
ncbi:MAG: citrate/2-methylcitrate synthase [Acidobacteriota bacterium]